MFIKNSCLQCINIAVPIAMKYNKPNKENSDFNGIVFKDLEDRLKKDNLPSANNALTELEPLIK